MADTNIYTSKQNIKKYTTQAKFDAMDKSGIPVGTEYNIVGQVEESDLSSELQTKINASTTYTGTSGVTVNGATISAQLQDYTKESAKALIASDGYIRPVKLDSEGNLSVRIPSDGVGAYDSNIQVVTSGDGASGYYYQVGVKSEPTFDSIYLTRTNLRASTVLAGITVSLPSKSGTLATTDDLTGKQDQIAAGTNLFFTGNTLRTKDDVSFNKVTMTNGASVYGTMSFNSGSKIDMTAAMSSVNLGTSCDLTIGKGSFTLGQGVIKNEYSGDFVFPNMTGVNTIATTATTVASLGGRTGAITLATGLSMSGNTLKGAHIYLSGGYLCIDTE